MRHEKVNSLPVPSDTSIISSHSRRPVLKNRDLNYQSYRLVCTSIFFVSQILLKIGLLVRQENTNAEIMRLGEALRDRIRKLLMTIVSFVKVFILVNTNIQECSYSILVHFRVH